MRGSRHLAANRPLKRKLAARKNSTLTRAILRVPTSHSLRQHGLERVVATPEMVVEHRRGMKRNQAKEKEPDCLVHLQELPRERAVLADKRRQLAEEEQVHPVALRVGVEEPENRLGQQEGVERVFASMCHEPHRLRHVSGPVGEARELAPNQPTERHEPHGHAERPM